MDLFVGRTAELTEALDLLMSTEEGRVLDLTGVRGIGKTMFLHRLLDRAREIPDVVVRSIDMMSEGVGTGHHKRGSEATDNVFSDTYLQTCRLMLKATEGYERDFKLFRLKLLEPTGLPGLDRQAALGNTITLGRGAQVGPVTMDVSVHLDQPTVREHYTQLQARMDDEFVAAWRAFTRRRRVVVAVDSAELVADDEIGAWLLRTALRLPRTLVVLTRVPSLEEFGSETDRLIRRQLENLTFDEVRQYLTARLVGEDLPARLTEVVYAFTDGHPYGVALTAELIDEVGPPGLDPSRLRRLLARVPDDATKWGSLLKTLLDQVSASFLAPAVSAAAVVQRFDEPLLADLLADPENPGGPIDDVTEAMRALRSYRLASPVLSVGGQPTRWSRMHEFVRQAVDHRLRTDQRREWLRLHRRAADYSFRWLQEWEEADASEYGSWYRYEDPEWQAYEREWLYHSGFVTQRRSIARARFTLVFLEAFYWWGCYCPFDFNRQLIEDWERATATWSRETPGESPDAVTPEQRLADALLFLLDHYPLGAPKPATADWDEIRSVLLLVQELCGLGNTRPAGRAEERTQLLRTDSLIRVFLAHTRRYRDPADPVGERYYRQAQEGFERLDDGWMVSWLQRERADLALERGDHRAAEAFWRQAAAGALRLADADEWDHELAADLYRIAADTDFAADALPAAATGYGRAVAEAYWYQDRPHLPDEYTQEFYQEMTGRCVDRILAVAAASSPASAVEFAATLARQVPGGSTDGTVEPAIRSGDPVALAAALFPAGPARGELRADDSAFLRRWRLRWEDDPQDQAGQLAALLAARTGES